MQSQKLIELTPHKRTDCERGLDMSRREWREILDAQGHRCFYCGNFILTDSADPKELASPDHIWPLCENGCLCSGNVVAACGICNRMKQGKMLIDFLAERPQFLRTMGEFSTRVLFLKRTRALFWNHLGADLCKLAESKRIQ